MNLDKYSISLIVFLFLFAFIADFIGVVAGERLDTDSSITYSFSKSINSNPFGNK